MKFVQHFEGAITGWPYVELTEGTRRFFVRGALFGEFTPDGYSVFEKKSSDDLIHEPMPQIGGEERKEAIALAWPLVVGGLVG